MSQEHVGSQHGLSGNNRASVSAVLKWSSLGVRQLSQVTSTECLVLGPYSNCVLVGVSFIVGSCVRKLWPYCQLWMRQSTRCSSHKAAFFLKSYINYDKYKHLNTRTLKKCLDTSTLPLWKRQRPRKNILASFHMTKDNKTYTTRYSPSLYLSLLKLTVNVTSCFACFHNKNNWQYSHLNTSSSLLIP